MKPTARERLKQLGGRSRGGLEAGGDVEDVDDTRRAKSLDRLKEELAHRVVENPRTHLGSAEASAFFEAAEEAMARLAHDGPAADLTDEHQFGLEAIIETDGSRPSVPIKDGWIDTTDPRLGEWSSDLVILEQDIRKAIAATARIVVDGSLSENSVNGTAVMIAPFLALTAKHVVEQTFERLGEAWHVPFQREITLDFHVEAGMEPRPDDRITITRVKKASEDTIGHALLVSNLDLAVLELADAGPPPAPHADLLALPRGRPLIHVVGHPKRVAAPTARADFEEILALIFGDVFGVKRWSPGEIRIGPGQIAGDTETKRVITHDASTLAGNSGSPVFDLTSQGDLLVGLHYGGFFEKENYAHAGPHFTEWVAQAVSGTEPGDV